MKKLSLLFAFGVLLTGCASMQQGSYEAKSLTETERQTIANDGSVIMSEFFPPGKTTLNINDNGGKFGALFTEFLRKRGFAIADNGIALSYLIDPIDAQYIRLGLITPNWRSDALYLRHDGKVTRQNLTQRVE